MDKQLIERIALEVAKDYLKFKLGDRKGLDIYDLDLDDEDLKPLIAEIERECADSFMQFLASIDAERGKEAVAFRLTDGDDVEYNGIDQFSCGRTGGEPLFLSPTILEGMALVKKAVLRDRGFVYTPGNVSGAAIPIVTVQFDLNDWDSRDAFAEAMLDAAQGECNAD